MSRCRKSKLRVLSCGIRLCLGGGGARSTSATGLAHAVPLFPHPRYWPAPRQVGDVLLTYENEVILTNEVYGDKALPYLVPSYNIRIECPLALVDKVGGGTGQGCRHGARANPSLELQLRACAPTKPPPPSWLPPAATPTHPV